MTKENLDLQERLKLYDQITKNKKQFFEKQKGVYEASRLLEEGFEKQSKPVVSQLKAQEKILKDLLEASDKTDSEKLLEEITSYLKDLNRNEEVALIIETYSKIKSIEDKKKFLLEALKELENEEGPPTQPSEVELSSMTNKDLKELVKQRFPFLKGYSGAKKVVLIELLSNEKLKDADVKDYLDKLKLLSPLFERGIIPPNKSEEEVKLIERLRLLNEDVKEPQSPSTPALKGEGVRDDLVNKLTLHIGSQLAGNDNLKDDILKIITEMLGTKMITKKVFNMLLKKYVK